MTEPLTTADLAAALGVSQRRALQLAKARGVAPARTVGRSHLWTADAVEKLRPRASGAAGHARRAP